MVETRSPAVLAVTVIMICLSSLFVLFRYLSRGWLVKRIGLDDWFMLLAWVRVLSFDVGFKAQICSL